MSPANCIKRKLAYLAGSLNISARAAASEAMRGFTSSVIRTAFEFADEHPNVVHIPEQIFQGVSRVNIANELIAGARVLVDRALSGLTTIPVTLQMDAGTIYHHHFLNYVVSAPDQAPFLIRSEFRHSFDQFAYAEITNDVISEIAGHGVTVAGVVADNLVAQQAGLRLLVDESEDEMVRQLVICPCANHTLNLVFQSEIKENMDLQEHLDVFRQFQHIMRKGNAIRQYGKTCPNFPETRWFYICEVLRWIIHESTEDELVPWLMTCVAQYRNNEVGMALRQLADPDFRQGKIPEWIDKLHSVVSVLETLSLKFESRNCALWMVVPLVESAKCELLRKSDEENVEWIRELALSLTRRLIARFRQTFNREAAIAAYLLSPEGRIVYRGIPPGQTRNEWQSELLPLTAEQILSGSHGETGSDDLEMNDDNEELDRKEMANLLVAETEGHEKSGLYDTEIDQLKEIGIAEFGRDSSKVQDPDCVPDCNGLCWDENVPHSYKEELENLRRRSRDELNEPVFVDMPRAASCYLRDLALRFKIPGDIDMVIPDLLVQ
jgi:hypothetical protein